MNYFFHVTNHFLRSRLTIPRFSNSGQWATGMELYCARISDGRWKIAHCGESDGDYWLVDSDNANNQDVYFIAKPDEVKAGGYNSETLCDYNKFTDTSPAYRANLMVIDDELGGFSSYQSEYPFGMTETLKSLHSDCSSLTTDQCIEVGVFVRNINKNPVQEARTLSLIDKHSKEKLIEFPVFTNCTTYVDLTPFRDQLKRCALFVESFIGIPVYVIRYKDGGLSFEHTHPPHAFIGGNSRMKLVAAMRGRVFEKSSP
mgnify:CR=1 FL=1